eukprot:73898_1
MTQSCQRTKLPFGFEIYGQRQCFQTFDFRYRNPRRSCLWIRYESNSCVAKEITYQWNGGVGSIEISNILFIAHGHWTKLFQEYSAKNEVDKESCFSIVQHPKYGAHDVIADDKETAKHWIDGLRQILGHSDVFSLKLSQRYLESNFFYNYHYSPFHIGKFDDFTIAVVNVYKQLIKTKKWNIDYRIKFCLNTEYLADLLQQENVKWTHWNQWIKSKITHYLRSNGKYTMVAKASLVFGYIRMSENEHKSLIIPEEITSVCLAMYGVEIDAVDQYLDDKLPGLINYFRGNAFHGHPMEELLVYGYLRKIHKNAEHTLVLYDIFDLCLSCLSDDEYWNKHGDHCNLSKDGMMVTKMPDKNDFQNMTFGAKWINGDSALHHPITVQWKLKINKNNGSNHGIRIGVITKAETCRVNADVMDFGSSSCAFYYSSNENRVRILGEEYYFPTVGSSSSFADGIWNIDGNGMCLGENDIMDIQLDLGYTNKLEYSVNGKSIGFFFKHLPSAKYKLFISIQHKDDSAELIGFTKKYKKSHVNDYRDQHGLYGDEIFRVTMSTVFRNLEQERKWNIDQKCRDVMHLGFLHTVAIRRDIHWREWTQWIRSHVITYLSHSPQQSLHHSDPSDDTIQINKDLEPDQECVIM